MKKLLFTTAAATALFVFATTAQAQTYDWTGFYIGAQGGFLSADGDTKFDFVFNPADVYSTSNDLDGVIGGFHAGYNFQSTDSLVLGIEADINFGDTSDRNSQYYGPTGAPYGSIVGEADLNAFGSARLRAGYSAGQFLPYLTGGIAIADADFGYDFTATPALGNDGSDTLIGWTIGAGLEVAVSESVRVNAEYRFTDYGHGNDSLVARAAGGDGTSPGRFDLETHAVTAGVSFAF